LRARSLLASESGPSDGDDAIAECQPVRRLVCEKGGGDTIFCKDFNDVESIRTKMGGFGCCRCCGSGMPVEYGNFSASPTGDRRRRSLGKLTCCKLSSSRDSGSRVFIWFSKLPNLHGWNFR